MRHRRGIYPVFPALLVISMVIITTQCVEEYNPNITANDHLLVVNGSIIRGNEQQTIIVSRSTSVSKPGFIAVEGCHVFVSDDKNNIFRFVEDKPGYYHANIDHANLETGVKLKLTIETPTSQVYESTYEEIYDGPLIDSLYFVQEANYSGQPHMVGDGLRLNVDVYAREEFTGYYRWKIHETWESRSSNSKIDKILVGVKDTFITTYKWDSVNLEWLRDKAIPIPEFEYLNKPDTFHICYLDSDVEDIFHSSTSNIAANSRKRVPLHFIPNGSKISSRYSCLVSQYTLSEEAYNYWVNKAAEISESGGIYNTQPSQNLSNIKNINNDQETVLGYFWVSEMKQKRVFFEGPYLGIAGCASTKLFDIEDFYLPAGKFGEFLFNDSTYSPVYVTNDRTSPPGCFDCRFSGGTLNRPDFW